MMLVTSTVQSDMHINATHDASINTNDVARLWFICNQGLANMLPCFFTSA
jgi:hypothetical protein